MTDIVDPTQRPPFRGRPHQGLLASVFLVSNRPKNIAALMDSIEATVSDPSRIEVLVKVDEGDDATIEQMRREERKRPFRVKTLITPPPTSHFELWRSLNDLYRATDPGSYFLCNPNDELRFISRGWDDILARHVGLFDDDIFRLRVSRFKLRQYVDVWEAFYAPENYGFHTRRYIDIQGDWNACHVSDAFQQCVAFYLARGSYPGVGQYQRDVPIFGIEFGNQEAAEGLTPQQLERRNRGNDDAWYVLMGPKMQTEICRRARLLQAHIWAGENTVVDPQIADNPERRLVEVRTVSGDLVIAFSYQVDETQIRLDQAEERRHGDMFHYRLALNHVNERSTFLANESGAYVNRIYHTSRDRTGRIESAAIDKVAFPSPTGSGQVLVSLHLASRFPDRLTGLLDNIEQTANDPTCVEVLVKVDTEDLAMCEFMAKEVPRRRVRLRFAMLPRLEGYFSLWEGYNELIKMCDPSAYFVSLINDELRFATFDWDQVLRRYVGFFDDHLFRLRVSRFKYRNYYDFWECGYAPDAYAFYTKRWFDVSGDWNACNTPDAFQQFVVFYLSRATRPSPGNKQYSRDIPIRDLELAGEEPYRGLNHAELMERVRGGKRDWWRIVSHEIQEEANHRANRLLAALWAHENGHTDYQIRSDRRHRTVALLDSGGIRELRSFPYALSKLRIGLVNAFRRPLFDYYCGGNWKVIRFLVDREVRSWGRAILSAISKLRRTFRDTLVRIVHARRNPVLGTILAATGVLPIAALILFRRELGFRLRRAINARRYPEKHVVAHATSFHGMTPPENLIFPNWFPWGSSEDAEDVYVWMEREQPWRPRAIRLMLFSPGGRAHLRDVCVVFRATGGQWHRVPARLAGQNDSWRAKVTVPPDLDLSEKVIEIDRSNLPEWACNDIGIACLSSSEGFKRNYLEDGNGIYIRQMEVLETAECSAHTNSVQAGSPVENLLKQNGEVWGSDETSDDVYVWLERPDPWRPLGIRLALFSPGDRAHLRDVCVVARGKEGAWQRLRARVRGGEADWQSVVTVPPASDKTVAILEIDPGSVPNLPLHAVGIACLSLSEGHRRNYLNEGNGIYLREMEILE